MTIEQTTCTVCFISQWWRNWTELNWTELIDKIGSLFALSLIMMWQCYILLLDLVRFFPGFIFILFSLHWNIVIFYHFFLFSLTLYIRFQVNEILRLVIIIFVFCYSFLLKQHTDRIRKKTKQKITAWLLV